EPTQINTSRKFQRARVAPSLGESFDLDPAILPLQFGKDRLRFGEKLRQRRLRRKKRDGAEQFRNPNEFLLFRLPGAVLAQKIDVIDQNLAISPAQIVPDLLDR